MTIDSDKTPLRVLIAPEEVAGQMQVLAEILRGMGHQATAASYSRYKFGVPNDITFGHVYGKDRLKRLVQMLTFFSWAVTNYDIFHFFYGKSLLPYHVDLPILRLLGKKIVVHYRGSDIRNPDIFHYRDAVAMGEGWPEDAVPPLSLPRQLKDLRLWRKYADAVLIACADLLEVIPDAVLLQQVKFLHQWPFDPQREAEMWQERPVRVLHAPTSRFKKNTGTIIESVDELKAEGRQVELVLVEDVPYTEAMQIYRTCHIGTDTLIQKWYGNIAIELMALGKPVIGYVAPEFKKLRPDVPIVNTTPLEFKQTLSELLDAPERCLELGRLGREYVEKRHSPEVIGEQAVEIYRNC